VQRLEMEDSRTGEDNIFDKNVIGLTTPDTLALWKGNGRCRAGILIIVTCALRQLMNKKLQKFNLRGSKRKLFAFLHHHVTTRGHYNVHDNFIRTV